MKLTMNTPLLDLAGRFNTSATSVNNIVTSQICAMHEVLFEGLVENNIPSLQKCKGSMPTSFGDFSSCRIVLDATEITQDVPGNDRLVLIVVIKTRTQSKVSLELLQMVH